MIAFLIAELATTVSSTLGAADGDDSPIWLLALGPAGAAGGYFLIWRYYRNTHRSHSFERETRIAAQPVTGDDVKVKTITGTRRSQIEGDNRSDHRKRVQRLG